MSALRDEPARRRLELNPLTTSLNVSQQPPPHQTPVSALSSNSLSAPFGYHPATYTPVTPAGRYNPQQWYNSPSVTSDTSTHFPVARSQDSEVVIPAPPPYSPPRSQRTSMILLEEPASGISPASRVSPANIYRSSPEPGSNPVFAPPPTTRTRGSSGGSHPVFNISAFARRPAPEPPRVSPELPRRPQPIPVEPQQPAPRVLPELSRRPQPISFEPQLPDNEGSLLDRPPASRRAVSAGAVSNASSSHSRNSSVSRWEPGMPLPPPPPGPPPQSRSQSMTRSSDQLRSPPTRRPPISTLGPVPPTPAGWVDDDNAGRGRSPNRGLTIDTSSIGSGTAPGAESNSGSSSSGLARKSAVRGESKSIKERRSESRAGRTVANEEASNNPWAESVTPSDIRVNTGLTRRPTINKSTPRSARSNQTETPRSAEMSSHNTPVLLMLGNSSRGSTPRPLNSSTRTEAPTPPFSPNQIRAAFRENSHSPAIPPKALPTPPPQSRLALSSPGQPVSRSGTNVEDSVALPSMSSRPGSRQSNVSPAFGVSPSEHFSRQANERHRAFAAKEAAAANDGERVRMFAEFIVTESRLRRERYSTAIDAMGSEILEVTRDLFRPYSSPRRASTVSRSSGWTPESSTGQGSHRGSISAALYDRPQIHSEPTSGSGPPSPALARPDQTWFNAYMPSLSPIPSMSVSEAPDGSDSRGRPSSRWWEVSQEGSNGIGSARLERSKRESKYMGMPRELREALQYSDTEPSAAENGNQRSPAGPSNQNNYGPNEYPKEKVGWHEDPSSPPSVPTPGKSPAPFSPAPFTPNPDHLDVSRLITLPPPYPRHHPAVGNNHPDLTSIRTIVRTLSDLTEVEATKARFLANSAQIKDELETSTSKRRHSLRANIQREVSAGNMTYADAAKLEETAKVSEQEKMKEAIEVEFELFQSQVVMPLNDLLMDRVNRSKELFSQLRSKLFVDAQHQDPNSTQEEGDEQPELLEKLTLLKWIFEARELLEKELFDLLTDRNDRYKNKVVLPYQLTGNEEKVKGAEKFFAGDASKRRLQNEQDILKRTEEFMDIIEENVVRGVEVQLSAFWDIAPSLSRITDKIPTSLRNFQIQIPGSEYEENPAYYDHPMQYLYSLLAHCEKSTYQFIESQTNLLCLLHEVKSGVTTANCRLMRTQRVMQGEAEEDVDRELRSVEKDEEDRLTDDLKEKVRCVEELWGSALGNELKGVKGRIMRFLEETGGWVDEE